MNILCKVCENYLEGLCCGEDENEYPNCYEEIDYINDIRSLS